MSAVLQPWWVVPVLAVVGALIGVFLDGVVHGVPHGSGTPRRSGASAFRRGWLVTVGTAVAYALIGWGVCAGWYPAALMPANAADCTPVRANSRECCFSVSVLMWR